MKLKKESNKKWSMTILLVMIAALTIGCSSSNYVRKYNSSGNPEEISFIKDKKSLFTAKIEYDNRGRIISMIKTDANGKKLLSRKFKYSNENKVILHDFEENLIINEKPVVNSWVESFTYNRQKNLSKIETSYNSSYSISSNNTPFATTTFNYNYNLLNSIIIDGGTFSAEYVFTYKNDILAKIEFTYSLLDKKKKPEVIYHLSIEMKDDQYNKITDLVAGKRLDESDIAKLKKEKKLLLPYVKYKYSSDYKLIIKDAEKLVFTTEYQ